MIRIYTLLPFWCWIVKSQEMNRQFQVYIGWALSLSSLDRGDTNYFRHLLKSLFFIFLSDWLHALPYFLELLDLGEQETRLCRNLNQNVCEAVQPSISSSLKPMKDNNGFLLFLISFVRSDAALCCWLILLSLETYEILIHSSFAILTFSSYKNKTSKQQFSKSCVSRRLGRKNQQSLLPMYLCSLNLNKINWWSALIYF